MLFTTKDINEQEIYLLAEHIKMFQNYQQKKMFCFILWKKRIPGVQNAVRNVTYSSSYKDVLEVLENKLVFFIEELHISITK